MSYAPIRFWGDTSSSLAGLPPTAYATTVGRAVLTDEGGGVMNTPEAQLAASVFEGAMRGDGNASAAINQAGATMAAVGAAAACAATGAGAAVAPLCAMAGSFIYGKLSEFLGSGGMPCLDFQEEFAQQAMAPYLYGGAADKEMFCNGDSTCEAKISAAAYDYADRTAWHCSMAYDWPLTPTILEEAKKLGLPLWPVLQPKSGSALNPIANQTELDQNARNRRIYVYDLNDPRWIAFARQKFLGEVTAAIAARKAKTWTEAAADAKKVADAEYDALVRTCTVAGPPPIRVPGKLTPCEAKAARAASTIAARSYLFATIKGAPAIRATDLQNIRDDFRDEIKQDLASQKNAAGLLALEKEKERDERDARSRNIKAAAVGTRRNELLGIGLLAAAALGGVYVYSRSRR